MTETSLADCKKGDKLIIKHIDDIPLSVQLYCMGCIPGEHIIVERIAPFGDPILISVEDSFISLRKKDAALLKVKFIEN